MTGEEKWNIWVRNKQLQWKNPFIPENFCPTEEEIAKGLHQIVQPF